MELNEEGLASPLRGKTLAQKIAKNADYKTVLAAALKKRQNYDKPSSLNGNTDSGIPMANQLKPSLGLSILFFCGKVQIESYIFVFNIFVYVYGVKTKEYATRY